MTVIRPIEKPKIFINGEEIPDRVNVKKDDSTNPIVDKALGKGYRVVDKRNEVGFQDKFLESSIVFSRMILKTKNTFPREVKVEHTETRDFKSPVTVKMTAPKGHEIRYVLGNRLSGEGPTERSNKFKKPFKIKHKGQVDSSDNVVIKAKSFFQGRSSEVVKVEIRLHR